MNDWPPAGCDTIYYYSLGSVIQPVFNPVKRAPVQDVGCQLFHENAMGEVQVADILRVSIIRYMGHLVVSTAPATMSY